MRAIYTHKGQLTIIWATHIYSLGDGFSETKINVRYSYLRGSGRIGTLRSKVMFESDFASQFKHTDRKVKLHWSES